MNVNKMCQGDGSGDSGTHTHKDTHCKHIKLEKKKPRQIQFDEIKGLQV